jgi:hypothetical protein
VFRTASACAARLRRFGAEKVRAFQAMRDTFGEPDLARLSETYGHPVIGEAWTDLPPRSARSCYPGD